MNLPPLTWNVIIQVFAYGVSAARGHEHRTVAIRLAHLLAAALLGQLDEKELLPKCTNFLVEGEIKDTRERPKEVNCNTQIQRTSQDLDLLEAKSGGEGERKLPF